VPAPGPGEVLIKTAASGVNRPDLAQRAGTYPPPPGASDLPGLEVAGTVAALGDGVTDWGIGDKVCALTAGGSYAEYCTAHATHCLPVPDNLTWVQAGALCETYFTVWTNVFERGGLLPGETLLIHGGASGIGTTAIQVAREWGATVLCTVGTPEKAAAVEALGAKRAINYRTEDFVEIVKAETGGKGADVILDMVAGDYVPRNLQCLAMDGRLVIIALLGGPKAEINFGLIMRNRHTITGSTLRPQTVEAKARIARGLRENVWPMLASGRIAPIIHGTFPLAEAAQAHAALEAGEHVGKFVLTVD
jgi:NADPH2:quinone reductase